VANTRGYAAQVSVTQSTGGTGAAAPTASITPGSITTGFNLHLLPKIRNDGSILLQYGMNISELVGADNGFDTFSSNGSSIQLPNVNQRNFIQEAILPNSSTLVLTGFEQVQSSATKNGPFNSSLFALGGSNSSALSRQILVITISPTVLDASVAANPPRQ
jgi:type II secretory pathway component GspD/PulD (secretin)